MNLSDPDPEMGIFKLLFYPFAGVGFACLAVKSWRRNGAAG
jgi:hypothetical protein